MTIISMEKPVESAHRGPVDDASWVYRWAANRLGFERWLLTAEGQVDRSAGAATQAVEPLSA